MKYINNFLLVVMLLLFSACGGGGSNSSSNSQNMDKQPSNHIKYMSINKPEELREGDKIIRHKENTIVAIETDIKTRITTVILKEGNASIESNTIR